MSRLLRTSLLLLLIVVPLLIFFVPLFFLNIVGFDEAQNGLRVRALVSSGQDGFGHWLFPSVSQPPLFYWLGSLLARLQGGVVDALAVRLPSAVFATAGIWLVWWLGRRMISTPAGFTAALIVLSAPLYVEQARAALPDMALCFFVTLSLSLFFCAYQQQAGQEKSRRKKVQLARLPYAPYLFGLSCIGAVLSKGPVGGVLIALPILAFVVWQRELSALKLMFTRGSVLLVLALVGTWWAGAVWWYSEQFWRTQIGEKSLDRFWGGIDIMPPVYYLDVIFSRFAPWSFFLPFAVWQAFRSRQPGPVFLALCVTTMAVFFQLVAYKQARYILPLFPLAAVLVGWWLTTQREALTNRMLSWPGWPDVVKLAGVAGGVMACLALSVLASSQSEQPTACHLIVAMIPPRTPAQTALYCDWLGEQLWLGLGTWGVVSVGMGALLYAVHQVKLGRAFGLVIAQCVVFYAVIQPSWLMIDSRVRSPQAVAQQVLEASKETGQVFLLTPLTRAEDPGVPAVFHLQKDVRVITVWWPPGQPPADLVPGYYLVPVRRQWEILTYPYGQWQGVAIHKQGQPWAFLLLAYVGPPSSRAD